MKAQILLITFLLSTLFINAQDLAAVSNPSVDPPTEKEEINQEEVKAEAEEEVDAKNFSVSGSIDAYFRANLNGSNNPSDNATIAPATSFANNPGFSLGMANVIGEFSRKNVGAVADLVFGPRGADAVFGSQQEVVTPEGTTTVVSGSATIINQLYAYWNVTDKIKLTIGNFNTFLGYEVISPTGDFNYSTSYLFSYGPFSHTGIKADFDLGNGFSLMTAVMDPTDATEFNPTGEYAGGLQLGYAFDQGSIYLNGIVSEGFYQADITAGFDVSEQLYLGLNSSYAQDNFFGVALYAQHGITNNLSAGIRAEYFSNEGLFGETVDHFMDYTLSLNYKVGDLTIIPEIRLDTASDEVFNLRDAENPEMSRNLSSFVLAAVYQF